MAREGLARTRRRPLPVDPALNRAFYEPNPWRHSYARKCGPQIFFEFFDTSRCLALRLSMKMQLTDTQDDAEFLREFAANGSHDAFATLVKRHGPMAHGIAMRVLSSHHDAQDVTQAVFILLARDAEKLASRPSVAGWIYTVARRIALNAHKSRERRQRREQTAMEHSTITTTRDPVQGATFRRELDTAIERLPERYRQPLLLAHLEGVPLHEVAKRLALHPDTLRTRLSRARVKLRELLRRRGVEVASVTALGSLLTAELKASSTFTPGIASTLLDGAIGGAAVSPHVLELVAKAASTSTTFLTTLTLLMKTKTTSIAIFLAVLATGGATLHLKYRSETTAAAPASPVSSVSSARKQTMKPRKIAARNSLYGLSRNEFRLQVYQVLLSAEDERLSLIRERLGMDLSDDAYRKAVAAYGYQIRPEKLYEELLKQWMIEDPRSVTLWANGLKGSVGNEHIRSALAAWLATDEATARAWAEENLEADWLTAAQKEAESIKLKPKPLSLAEITGRLDEVHRSLKAITDSDQESITARNSMGDELSRLIREWAVQDPAAAVKFGTEHYGEMLKLDWTLLPLIVRWGQLDPDAALQWVKETKDEELREWSLESVLSSWQLKHPDKSISDVVDLGAISDAEYASIIGEVVGSWAIVNTKAAMDFALAEKDPMVRWQAVTSVIGNWAMKSPGEAGQWITDLPAGELRDFATKSYIWVGTMANYDATERLVREIQNPEMRKDAIRSILFHTDAIAQNLPKTLELAREYPVISPDMLDHWIREINPKDVSALRTWIDQAAEEGQIKFNHPRPTTDDNPVSVALDPEEALAEREKILRALEKRSQQK
jgi:RNA polymerase sigma factor (sigma-70 family)